VTRRLFFAVWPEPALRQQLEALSAAAPPGWHPVPAADLHLTVLFLGTVPEDRLAPLCAAVGGVPRPAFDQPLTRLESWSKGTLWCMAGDTVPALAALHRDLAALVAGLGLAREDRAYRPHVTLARARRHAPAPPATAPGPLQLAARALVLAQSSDRGPGSRYRPLRRWALGGASGVFPQTGKI
jgi:RNA 2',3'-cyclic 3'-phosphodiesterase